MQERQWFDIRHGTQTFQPLHLKDFKEGQVLEHSKAYFASWTSEIKNAHRVMKYLLQDNFEDFIFFDLGCGKGKVCILWELLNLRDKFSQTVIGIDYYLPFIQAASANYLKVFHRQGRFIHSSVEVYNFKECHQPVIIYLFNPFDEIMLEKVLKKLSDSLVYIVYNIPMHWKTIEANGYRRIYSKTGKNQNQITLIYTNQTEIKI